MCKTVITAEGLGKSYMIGHQQKESYSTLRDMLANIPRQLWSRLRNPQYHTHENVEEFWALKDVNFEIKQGDRVGIIGRNGAGKSTLLKILSRITEPTTGKVKIAGRVASLLEVGTGFHPELTGRENIFLNGAIMGMSRTEIKNRFDEIVAFSEVEKFLDTPVKRYSSGMYVRLAFAVAAHLEPEILVVDEVLAVGDASFQKKCLGKMDDVAKEGRTVLFVSHNMGAIGKLCEKVIWLNSGKFEKIGNSHKIIENYLSSTYDNISFRKFQPQKNKTGQITSVRLLNDQNIETTEFTCQTAPVVEISFELIRKISGCHLACVVTRIDGYHMFSTADTDTNEALFGERLPGEYVARVTLPTSTLNTGVYQIAVGLGIPGIEVFDRQETVSFTIHDVGDFGTLKERSRRAGLLVFEVPWHYLD